MNSTYFTSFLQNISYIFSYTNTLTVDSSGVDCNKFNHSSLKALYSQLQHSSLMFHRSKISFTTCGVGLGSFIEVHFHCGCKTTPLIHYYSEPNSSDKTKKVRCKFNLCVASSLIVHMRGSFLPV